MLLAPQQIAGAAQLEVECCDAEAGAQLAELLERREPLPGKRGKRAFRRHQQVGVGALIRAADAPAELIQLCSNTFLTVCVRRGLSRPRFIQSTPLGSSRKPPCARITPTTCSGRTGVSG